MMIDETAMQDDRAEQTLLGAVGHHPDACAALLATVPAEAFYDPARGAVWAVLRRLSDEQQPISPVTIHRALAGADQWTGAAARVVQREMAAGASVDTAQRMHRLVMDLAERRELVRALKRAGRTVSEHPGDASEALAAVRGVFDQLGGDDTETGGTRTWSQLLDEFEDAHAEGARTTGLPTPWYELDEMTGGLHGGRMYVIGGSPGDGKSTAALQIASCVAGLGSSVLVFSKEMPNIDVMGRFVAAGAEVNLSRINRRGLREDDRQRFAEFRKRTRDYRLRVNDAPVTMSQVARIARSTQHRHGLDLLVVDYLQLMTGDTRGRSGEEEIAEISTALKRLAMELGIPVVVPAQLNRGPHARPDSKPTMHDLRGSGRIEQDSDVVILLWRRPVEDPPDSGEWGPDPDNLTFLLGKNRHGPPGQVTLRWNGGYGAIG